MRYFDDPVINSRFNQFIDLFAELIEKYGGELTIPAKENQSWENDFHAVQSTESSDKLTNHCAA